jgi:octaprenyl-diphosphate synthase
VNRPPASVPDLGQGFSSPFGDELARVEREFARPSRSRVELIPQMGKYVQMSGGKRVRPAVLLMAAGSAATPAIAASSTPPSSSSSTPRRSSTTTSSTAPRRGAAADAHSRWGSDITVLLGDYLYIRSMAMALTQDTLEVVRLLCDCTLRMIEGELYQLTKTGDAPSPKTSTSRSSAARRRTCSRAAPRSAAARRRDRRTARRAARVRLQPRHRVPDRRRRPRLHGRRAVLGKPIGGDLREGKVTLPVILLLQQTGPDITTLVQRVITEGQISARHLAHHQRAPRAPWRHRRRVRTGGHLRRPRQAAADAAFPPSVERDGLIALVDYVLTGIASAARRARD